ncbi:MULTISPECIES: hypothetical protein [Burkholderia]|uniref:hypothetical protein n=1 Tax=Burkholderia TaxID=32008 RepID=UPI0015840838|nr:MULTISPECIES: hypothetical protein [Burkholderia]
MMGRPVFDPRTRCPILGVVMLYFLKQTPRDVNESMQCRTHAASPDVDEFSSLMLYFLKHATYATGSAIGECERSDAPATGTKEFT